MPADRTPEEAALNSAAATLLNQHGAALLCSGKRLKQTLTAFVQVKRAHLEPGDAVAHLEAAFECIADQDRTP